MVLKKVPIISMYLIHVYCEKCNRKMNFTGNVLPTNPLKYEYKCDQCNCTCQSEVGPNCTAYNYDIDRAEVVSEESVVSLL